MGAECDGTPSGLYPHTFPIRPARVIPAPRAFATRPDLPNRAIARAAQEQAAVFFATDGAETIDPDGAGLLFEVPIEGSLPEDFGYIP